MASSEPHPFRITASVSVPAFASTSYSQLSLRQPIILPSNRSHLHFLKPRHRISTAATFHNSVSAAAGPASFSSAAAAPAWEQKWEKCKLSYSFDSSFPKDDEAKRAIQRAFQEWEEVSIFSFFLSYDGRPDIVIGMHSSADTACDCYPFDKEFLAHATLPPRGTMHFNSDRNWNCTLDGPPQGSSSFDLQSVALHEIGHILGLKHSRNRNAVMYKSIKPGKMKRRLTKEDIDRLESLYLYSKFD